MTNYEEEIVCNSCNSKCTRKLEVKKIEFEELDQPLNVIIIKKFKCKHCNETENYKSNIKVK